MLLCFAGCHKNIPTGDGASNPSSAISSQVTSEEEGNTSSSEEQNRDSSVSSQETLEPEEVTESLPDLQASPGGEEEGTDRAVSGDSSDGSSSGVSATVTYQTGGRGYYPAITNYEPSYQTLTESQKVAYRCIATAVSYMRTVSYTHLMKNIITTCCPSVNRLVEIYYPELVDQMAPVVSPMIAHARLLKQSIGKNIRVVFVGPCISKKDESADMRHDTDVLSLIHI